MDISTMHSLFLQGWAYEIDGKIAEAVNCYKEAVALGDRCAEFQWNWMDRYGQGVPVNFHNTFMFHNIVVKDEEYDILMKCYEAVPSVEHRFNIGRLFDSRREHVRSFEIYKGLDYAPAQHCVGLAYYHGTGVDRDDEQAYLWLTLAATNGKAPGTNDGWYLSYNALGCCYHNKKDYVKARELYLKGVGYDCKWAQTNLGLLYLVGHGVERNYDEARKWLVLGAKQRNSVACKELAVMYRDGLGVTQNYCEAMSWLVMAAEDGDLEAQKDLGIIYADGIHTDKNIPEAIRWLTLAVESKNETALTKLASIYVELRDFEHAFHWYSVMAECGYLSGQINLGLLYVRGCGVIQNYTEAAKWFQLGVDRNNAWAQGELGLLYLNGQGVPRDAFKGAYLLYLSAVNGYAYGQCNLGNYYYNGIGTPKNETEALKWWLKSADQNDLEAQYRLGIHYYKLNDYYHAHKYFTLLITNTGPDISDQFVSEAKTNLMTLNNICHQILIHLNDYKLLKNNEGPSYLFFCNFMNYLIQRRPRINHHNILFRTWVTDHLSNYFKQINPQFDGSTIGDWFIDLFGE
jgi:TPR repeat protein